jgi:hypothetical protein
VLGVSKNKHVYATLHHEKHCHMDLEIVQAADIESADYERAGGGTISRFEPSNNIKGLSRNSIRKEWTMKAKIIKQFFHSIEWKHGGLWS